jgi:IPT/TIG domain
MAQSALTVTPPNPTPPTNLSTVGNTPPLDPAQAAADDGIPVAVPNSRLLTPVVDASYNEPSPNKFVFAAKTAAANTASAPGAGMSVDNEGKGTETLVTIAYTPPYSGGTAHQSLYTVGAGPTETAATRAAGPNAGHASSLTPTTPLTPTLTSVTAASNVSGSGYSTLTATGTNFKRDAVMNVNGQNYQTTYVSPTSLTCFALKRTTAGTLPVNVTSGGITTANQNWTLS